MTIMPVHRATEETAWQSRCWRRCGRRPARPSCASSRCRSYRDDAALLKVEVAGICGTDVKMYAQAAVRRPGDHGPRERRHHRGRGRRSSRAHGLAEGDRIFVEHYVGCCNCEWCRLGEYRHCEITDWRTNPDARRYGYTSSDNPGTLWGGFSQYMYLPWNAVPHKVPDGVTAELAGLVTPLSNGIEWALIAGRVGYAATVLIQGPGQQGLSQVVACKQAGASLIIVTGTTRDASPAAARAGPRRRRRRSTSQQEDPLERVLELTGGTGVDVVLDCTSGRAPPRCCSASTRSSAARAPWSSRASWPRSPTSRSRR